MFKVVKLTETPKVTTGGDVRKRPGRPKGAGDSKPRVRRTRAEMAADLKGSGTRPRPKRQVKLLTPREEEALKKQRAVRGKAQRARTKGEREARAELELDKLSRQAQEGTAAERKAAREQLRDVEIELSGRPLTIAEARKLSAARKEREARRIEDEREGRAVKRGEAREQREADRLKGEIDRLIIARTADGGLTRLEIKEVGAKLEELRQQTGLSSTALLDEFQTQGVLSRRELFELQRILSVGGGGGAATPPGGPGAGATPPGGTVPLTPAAKGIVAGLGAGAAVIKASIDGLTDVKDARAVVEEINRIYKALKNTKKPPIKIKGGAKVSSVKGALTKFVNTASAEDLNDIAVQFGRGPPPPLPTLGHADPMPLHEHVKRACRHTFDHMEAHGKRKSMDHIKALREVHRDLERALKFIKAY